MSATNRVPRLRRSIFPRSRWFPALGKGVVLCFLALGSAAAASDFWHSKPPDAWSEKETDQLLNNSPWARPVEIIATDLSLASRVGGLQGRRLGGFGGFGRPGGGGGAGGDGAGNLGGGSFLPSPQRLRITIRWTSAWPIVRAVARKRGNGPSEGGSGPPAVKRDGTDHGAEPDAYVYRVAVVRIPLGIDVGSDEELVAATSLVGRDGRVRHADSVRFGYEDDLQTLEFAFARTTPLTVADRMVEFKTRLGNSPIKARFRLDQMVIAGRTAL